MRRRLLVFYFASCGVSLLAAQPNPDPKSDSAEEPRPAIFAPRPAPKNAKSGKAARPIPSLAPTRRAISPEMAAKLSAVATSAAPPATATPPVGAGSTAPPGDSSDAVQLQPYVVLEERLPEFKERDLLTPKGKLELARRRYPGLVGPFSDATALRMLEEDFAKERRQELADLKGLMEIGGTKLPRDVKQKIDDAAMRPSGFSPQIGEPFRPPK